MKHHFFVSEIPGYDAVFYFRRKVVADRMCIRHTANTFACMRIPPVRASPDTPNVQNGESLR